MTALPKDVVVDLRRRIAELEQQLQSTAAERDEAIAQQAATAEILQVINSSPADLAPVFEAILDKALRPCEAQIGVFWTYDGESMRASAIRGAPPAYVEFLQRGPYRPSHVQLRLLGGTEGFVQIADLINSEGYRNGDALPRAAADLGGIRTLLVVPLRRHGAILGTFGIYRQEVKPFTDRQITLVESFAAQAVIAMENARLFNATQQALERQNASAEILSAIASSPSDAERSLQQIVEITARLFGAPSVSLRIAGADEWSRTIRVGTSEERIVSAVSAAQQRIGARNLPGTVLLENRQIHIPDLDNVDPAIADWPGLPPARAAGTRAMAGTPLRRQSKAIGVLIVHRDRPVPFSADELALQQSFADQAVIAIENARLFNETKEALERQTATAEILKVIASSPSDVQPVFAAIATSSNRLVGGFSTAVFRFVDGVAHLAAFTPTANPGADEVLRASFPRPVIDFQPFEFAQAGKVVQVADTETSGDIRVKQIARVRGFRSMLFSPLMNKATLIGTISVTRVEPGKFSDHHVQLLQTFADQAVIAIENARLFEEVQARTRDLTESLQQQTATAEVLKVISRSTFDLPTVLQTLVESAARLCEADKGTIARQKGGEFYRAESFGFSREFMDYVREIPITLDRGSASGRALLEGVVIHIPDVEKDPDFTFTEAARLGDIRANLGVPMLREGRPVGVFSLTRSEPQPFTDKQIELVATFADQAVIAIENVRLFDEVQAKTRDLSEALTYQTGSSNILSVIASSPTDVAPVLKAIVESACELCDAYDALVRLKDGDDLRLSAHHGSIPTNLDRVPINSNWTAGRAFLDQKPVHVHDLLSSEGDQFPQARALSPVEGGHRTILSVPLLREGESIGVIVLRRIEVHPFSDKQIALLQTFADQAVIALGNVRLFEEVQARTEDLRELLEFQTATSDVLKVISSSPDSLQPVLNVIVGTARHLCGTETSTIFLLRDEKFHIAAASGARPDYMEFLQKNPIALDQAGSSTSRAAREKRTVHIPDIGADPEFGQGPMAVGQRRALLSVPLMREGTAIGVITMRQSHLTPFTERQIEVVQTFADQAVIAISNVRLFEEVQAKTRDLTEALTYQTGSSNILSVIASSPTDVAPVLKAIVDSACDLCDAYDAAVLLSDGDQLRFRAHHGPIPISFDKLPINRNWTAGRAFVDRKPIHVHDLLAEGDEFPLGQELSQRMGHRSILSVPLLREGESIGTIVLRRTEVHPFSDKQIALLQTFADQAVIAIGNVRLFEEVQERTRELSKSLDDLRTAQDRLIQTEKLASLGQLTAGIAHEIKNPLNFVNNFASLSAELTDELNEVLAPAPLDDKVREEVDEITQTLKDNLTKVVQHGKRADSIVKNMLLHSREGSGEHRPADINALLDESLNLAYHGARAEKREFNVTLQRDFDDKAGIVEVFPQEITRVFLNLIANGFYAVTKRNAENGGSGFDPVVRATTKNLGDTVEIRIRDNGTGIPAEVKEKMFNPFFTTKPAGEGTGLGLSMSHDIIVKQHGGTIDVETEPGHFTEFRIVLPRTSHLSKQN